MPAAPPERGAIPKSRVADLLVSSTSTSMITSGRALSTSVITFSASATLSAGPRIIKAFIELTGNIRRMSVSPRIAVAISCSSCGVETFVR